MSDEVNQAFRLVTQIDTKAEELLMPMKRQMAIASWAPEYRAIMWNTIAAKAMKLAEDSATPNTGAAQAAKRTQSRS